MMYGNRSAALKNPEDGYRGQYHDWDIEALMKGIQC